MTPGAALGLALALVGLTCCVVATGILLLTAGRGRSRARRDAFGGITLGIILVGIAMLLQG